MNIAAPFIRRPVATSLMMFAVACLGAVAFFLLPVAPLPQVDYPNIQVSAQLPGASPEVMASSVASPLERQFGQIAGVVDMNSTSTQGGTQINLTFTLDRDIDAAAQDVQAAITAAGRQLPAGMSQPPSYRKTNPADSPILILSARSDTLTVPQVSDYVDNILAQQISQVDGVALVSIAGQQKPAVRIQIDPARLTARDLTLEEVRNVVGSATVNTPKGSVHGDRQSFTVAANDQLTTVQEYNNLILAYRGGAPIRVRDVGQAVSGPEDAYQTGWASGRRGVLLIVFKQPGVNVIDTVERVKALMPKFRALVPAGLEIDVISDRTITIRASVHEVEFTLAVTIALVILVVLLFLRNLRATAVTSVVVPLSLLGAFALMYALSFSLDNLSLMALTIAVGFVVDDAIVVVENIYRHIEKGERPFDAALKGAGEVAFTVFSISVSLVAVFLPILLMGGIIGRLFREFALTVTAAIAVSVVVALTLVPMLAARFLKHSEHEGGAARAVERGFTLLHDGYRRTLDAALRHQFVVLMVFLGTLAATVALFIYIPKGFFPVQDTGLIAATTQAGQDTSPAEMVRLQEKVMDVIGRDPGVEGFASFVGGGSGNTSNTGRLFITLKPREDRDASATQIINRLRPQLAGLQGVETSMQALQDIRTGGRPGRALYQFMLQDANLEELNTWVPRVAAKLRTLPELIDVSTDLLLDAPQLTVTVNRDRAAQFGIDATIINNTLNSALGQRQITEYYTQLNNYNIVMEVLPKLQGSADVIDYIYIRSPKTGAMVPLNTLATVDTKKTGPLSVTHQSQLPAATISFNLRDGVALGQAVSAITTTMREMGAPSGLNGTFQGNAQAFQSSLKSQPVLIVAALVVIYIILGILYESFIHPLTILSTLPSAGVGALLILWGAGFDLSVIGIIGIILLIGIVKKNGILLVDFAITAERDGKSPVEAIREACLLRFRPILMTTMAAMLAGLPLMLGTGTGAEFRQPLGYAMVGGLMLSQLLTLYTTPVVYLYLDRLTRGRGRRRTMSKPRAANETALPRAAE